MSSTPTNSVTSYVNRDLIIPDDYREMQLILTDYLRKIVEALNDKEIGHYEDVELLTGQRWFTQDDNNTKRDVYRKVINISDPGGILAGSPYAHGITISATTEVVRIYGAATDPSTAFIPLPYVDVTTPANGIQLDMDATSINLSTTAGTYTGFTTGYVVVEYI